MPDRYPHFWGGSQICGQSAPPVKGTNGEKLKMLNCKFACISDPAANTMQTAVIVAFCFKLSIAIFSFYLQGQMMRFQVLLKAKSGSSLVQGREAMAGQQGVAGRVPENIFCPLAAILREKNVHESA